LKMTVWTSRERRRREADVLALLPDAPATFLGLPRAGARQAKRRPWFSERTRRSCREADAPAVFTPERSADSMVVARGPPGTTGDHLVDLLVWAFFDRFGWNSDPVSGTTCQAFTHGPGEGSPTGERRLWAAAGTARGRRACRSARFERFSLEIGPCVRAKVPGLHPRPWRGLPHGRAPPVGRGWHCARASSL